VSSGGRDAAQENEKRLAALAAVQELPPAGVIGLGTGSTVRFFIDALADLVRNGHGYVGVCTSEATRSHASAVGIPLLADDGPWTIDVTVDGADEVDDALHLSKGAGGALAREKIVSFASRRNVIVCDSRKRVHRLGETRPIALEVLAFGHQTTIAHLAASGQPRLRSSGGQAVRTDGGNLLVDLMIAPTDDPAGLDRALRSVPGVVETGLFVGRADVVLIAETGSVVRLTRAVDASL
jgi:ribose 5-phosphate isomerase A